MKMSEYETPNQRGNEEQRASLMAEIELTQNPQRQQEGQRLKELREENQEWQTLVGEHEERLQNLQTTAFQLANYYFVFQGVILTAISNSSSSLTCDHRWFLFTLSLLAAVLNLYALITMGVKYFESVEEYDRSLSAYRKVTRELRVIQQNSGRMDQNRLPITRVSDRSGDDQNQSPSGAEDRQWRDHYTLIIRCFNLGACIVLFLGFAGVTLTGCWRILCHHDECKPTVNHRDNGN